MQEAGYNDGYGNNIAARGDLMGIGWRNPRDLRESKESYLQRETSREAE